jgi:hypothetical protein
MNAIERRLQNLESRIHPEPMEIEVQTADGSLIETTVSELEQLPGAHFVRVISGGNLHDLDRLLAAMREAAEAEGGSFNGNQTALD